jgi:hypothetical protein
VEDQARTESKKGRDKKASLKLRAGMAQAEVEHRELYRNGLQDPELD